MRQPEDEDPRYRVALEALGRRGRFGIRLGLGRTRALLKRLDEPQAGLRGVLIGGTNGKGSVQALVAAALRSGGHLVGQTPKPHLVSYRERIVVDGRPIPAADFAALIEHVLREADVVARRLGPPTEFEVLTAAAFHWFRRAAVQVGVVEVGMGGRLDATNVWQGGVSAITNVALDHTEHLGTTIPAIAREKAAIIKRADAAALTGAEAEALAVIRRRARRLEVPLREVAPLPVLGMDRRGLRLRRPGGGEITVGLLGRHQAANAALALAILDELARAGIAAVTDDQVAAAFAGARWPGRLELLSLVADGGARPASSDQPQREAPDVILDGAHNPHGAGALADALAELRPLLSPGRPTLLLGVLADKDVAAMLTPLARSAGLADARVLATRVPDSARALEPAALAAAWDRAALGASGTRPRHEPARAIDDAGSALDEAMERARAENGPLVVCGSLYLVGFVRARLTAEQRWMPRPR